MMNTTVNKNKCVAEREKKEIKKSSKSLSSFSPVPVSRDHPPTSPSLLAGAAQNSAAPLGALIIRGQRKQALVARRQVSEHSLPASNSAAEKLRALETDEVQV